MANKIIGSTSGNIAEVNASNQLKVVPETDAATNPQNVGGIRLFSENDPGDITGSAYLASPETDDDFRIRVANDILLDCETFNYTAQNTGKHIYRNTTATITWGTGGMTTNGSNITTTSTGASFASYAEFPLYGSGSVYAEFEGGFSNQPVSNSIIDFGMMRLNTSNPYAPTDGVYFRHTSAGLQGVINNNGSETTTSVFSWTYVNNHKYQFIISITEREVEFWVDNVLYGSIETPTGQGQPFMSATLPVGLRHVLTGTAGGVINFVLNDYTVSLGGPNYATDLGNQGNRVLGSYQGLSGGTMGQLVAGTVTTGTLVKPTAVVPSNTALTAGLGNSLGGRSWESYTTPIAANTDAIIAIYQNPAGTISVQGRRLKVTGVKMSGVIQTAITGGPFTQEWYLIFGGTAISLQTTEAATTKPCRRIFLPEFTQNITAAQAANTAIAQFSTSALFYQPVYVNPGEYVGLANNWFGTAPSAGTAAYTYQFIYSWE